MTDRDRKVSLQAKPLAVLRVLIEHCDRVVSKDELISAVWPDVAVSEAAFTSVLRDLRRALGDRGSEQRFVETLRGRGFRLAQPVEIVPDPADSLNAPVSAAFIGREALLGVGEHALAAARDGCGQLLFLVGEAGIGKTRLAHELAARAKRAGFGLHVGRCLEEEGAPPYRPWLQILRSLLAGRPPRALEPTLDAGASEALSALLGARPRAPGPGADGAAQRFTLFDAVTRLVQAAARERACVLLLDDLHRADHSSLQLLRHVANELSDGCVLLLGTYRPAEAGELLRSVLDELHPAGTRLTVPGLAREEISKLVRAISGQEASVELTAALQLRTAGNPLFVEEITRALSADGSLDGPDAARLAAQAAPDGVRQVIRTRVARLPAGVRELLEAAAVIGREFEQRVLERVCPREDAACLRADLDAAVDAEIVEPLRELPGSYRFVHILLRDALYDGLSGSARAARHAVAGRALEALDPSERDARVDALAYHFEQAIEAGESEAAVRWARRAAEVALARAAYDESAEYASRALHAARASGAADDRGRAELLVLLGRARWFGGATAAARDAFREAAAAARAAGAPDLLARAALGFTGRTDATPGVNRPAVAMLEQALATLPEGEQALRAEVMARLGTELYYDDAHRGDELTERAVPLAEHVGDDALLAYVLSARHYLMQRPDVGPATRLAVIDRVVSLAEKSEARDVLALGLQERAFDLLELGEGLRLENCLHAYERVVEQLRQPFFRWFLSLLRGMRALLVGEVEEADRLAHATLALGQSFGSPNAFGVYSGQLFAIRREQGRIAELDAPLRAMVREQPDLPVFRTALAAIAGECGWREQARDAVGQLVEGDLDRFPRDGNWLLALSMLVPGAAIAGEPAWVQHLYERLSPYAGRTVAVGHGAACDGAVDHHLGILALALGDTDLADEHFSAARALHRQLRSPLWVAHTQREQSRALWKRGTPGDREQARRLQAEAIATYERLGLAYRAAQARAIGETA